MADETTTSHHASATLSAAVLIALREAGIPFLIGGGYAFIRYTGIERQLKDFDVFLRERDYPAAVRALTLAGIETTLPFPHWLGKAVRGDDFVDIIFGSGNGAAPVDDEWFRHARDDAVLGIPVGLVPPEEVIWTKAFVMERERFDGADVVHLLLQRAHELDWPRLLARFADHWQVLLGHLVFFQFAYPSQRGLIPRDVMRELARRLERTIEAPPPIDRFCRGTLLSRAQYLPAIGQWGFTDAREAPRGGMTEAEIEVWTAAANQVDTSQRVD
jgi:hypothetical protein